VSKSKVPDGRYALKNGGFQTRQKRKLFGGVDQACDSGQAVKQFSFLGARVVVERTTFVHFFFFLGNLENPRTQDF